MKKALVTNIQWDTDGDKKLAQSLPNQLTINIPKDIVSDEEIDEYVSDEISNISGFCHYGFKIKLKANY
jgi:hypothetical protein